MVTDFAKMQPAFATLDGWDQIVSYATKSCINACLIVLATEPSMLTWESACVILNGLEGTVTLVSSIFA